MIVNAQTGQIVQQANYSSFGETTFKSGDFISLGFAGGITDCDSDLVRFGARDFDPKTGRWTTKDPIRFDGGDLNIYRYVNNDPVNLIDPEGLFNAVDLAIFAAVGIATYFGSTYIGNSRKEQAEKLSREASARNEKRASEGKTNTPGTGSRPIEGPYECKRGTGTVSCFNSCQ